jgi:hypothetical protein
LLEWLKWNRKTAKGWVGGESMGEEKIKNRDMGTSGKVDREERDGEALRKKAGGRTQDIEKYKN